MVLWCVAGGLRGLIEVMVFVVVYLGCVVRGVVYVSCGIWVVCVVFWVWGVICSSGTCGLLVWCVYGVDISLACGVETVCGV